MARKDISWWRRHWKWVVLALLAVLAAVAIGALCATPAGAGVVAAIASVKIFAALATMSAPALFFVTAGMTAAAVLMAGVLFNLAVSVANWFDKKAGNELVPGIKCSWSCMSKETNQRAEVGTKKILRTDMPILSPDQFWDMRNPGSRVRPGDILITDPQGERPQFF